MSEEQDLLVSYVRKGNVEAVRVLLSIGVDPDTKYYNDHNYNYNSILWIALENHDAKMVKEIVEHGGNVNFQKYFDYQRQTLLIDAIKQIESGIATDFEIPLTIIKHSKYLNQKESHETPALVTAVKNKYTELVDALLEGGVDVNDGNPLAEAVKNNDRDTIKKLLVHKAIPNGQVICKAIDEGQIDLANLFVKTAAKQRISNEIKKSINLCLIKQPGFMDLPKLSIADAKKELGAHSEYYHDYQCHNVDEHAVAAFMNQDGYYELICATAIETAGHEEL